MKYDVYSEKNFNEEENKENKQERENYYSDLSDDDSITKNKKQLF